MKTVDEEYLCVDFVNVDGNMTRLGFTETAKKNIYTILSAILNLGNIEFEARTDLDSCSIKIESRVFVCNAAALLSIKESELEDALTSYTREIGNQTIK